VLDWIQQVGNAPLNPPEPPVELSTTLDYNKAVNLNHITPSERLRYIHNLLTSQHYEGGVGLTSDIVVSENSGAVGGKFIEAIFPPHDQEFNKKWITEWSHKWLLSISDITEIRDHFGEKVVAFYFAFLQYYFLALGLPAVVGLLTFIFAPLYSMYYAAFMIIWSTVFLAFWQYTAYGWAVRWGVKDYFKTERIRPDFRPETIREDELTGERVPFYPVWKRWVNFGTVTIPSVLGVILFLATLIISFLSLEIFITEYYNGPYKSILSLIPTVLYSALLPFITAYYQKLALRLNILENYPTDSSYDYAFTQKIFIFFSLVNWLALSVLGVLIVPFNDIIGDILERNGMGYVSLSSKSSSLGPKTLTDRVFYFVATAQVVNAFTETFLPMLTKKATKVIDEKIFKKTEKDASGDPDAVYVKRIIEELALPEYDVYEDYAEMTTQFGFTVLFSVAWPLAPVTSFINNFFELRGDAVKFCKNSRRPVPQRSDNIGPWSVNLSVVAWIGTILSTTLVFLYLNWHPIIPASIQAQSRFTAIITAVIIVEHAYFLLQYSLNQIVVSLTTEKDRTSGEGLKDLKKDLVKKVSHSRTISGESNELSVPADKIKKDGLSAAKLKRIHMFEAKKSCFEKIGLNHSGLDQKLRERNSERMEDALRVIQAAVVRKNKDS
ncbi:hypothetical protein HK096_006241, partial [Nowakowskiella sp. JEL0078]